MIKIDYPSCRFRYTAARAIVDGKDLAVVVRSSWRVKLLKKEFQRSIYDPLIGHNKIIGDEFKIPSIKISILMSKLISIHNFAIACKYNAQFYFVDGVHIIYSAPPVSLSHPTSK